MSTAHNKIIAKFQALDEYLSYLQDLQKVTKKSFLKDYHFYGLTEHYLHLSIEVVLDVSKLIIIASGFPRPEERRDALTILLDKKVITEKLHEQMIGITGFRNVLIHEYEKVNREIVYRYLQDNMDQFKTFKKQVVRFLGRTRP